MKLSNEELEEIMENDEGVEWDGDNAYQGLQILSKYVSDVICGADHDIIYGPGIDELLEAGLTKEDAKALQKLNWMLQDECFACYV